MKVTISHTEFSRFGKPKEVYESVFYVDKALEKALRRAAGDYRTTTAGMFQIILAYYFGDGSNHLGCSDCGYWVPGCPGCEPGYSIPGLEPGTQTTLPLLDKGSVVVGQPSNDLGV